MKNNLPFLSIATTFFFAFIVIGVKSLSVRTTCSSDTDCYVLNTYGSIPVKCWSCTEGTCVSRDVDPCWKADELIECMKWNATVVSYIPNGMSYLCYGLRDQEACPSTEAACLQIDVFYGPLDRACWDAHTNWVIVDMHPSKECPAGPCETNARCTMPDGNCVADRIPGCCVSDSDCDEFGDACSPSHCVAGTCTGQIPKDCAALRCATENDIPVACASVCSYQLDDCPDCNGDIRTSYMASLFSSPPTPPPSQCSGCIHNENECAMCIANPDTGGDMFDCIYDIPCHTDTCNSEGQCETGSIIVDDGNLCTVNHICSVVDGIPKLSWDSISCDNGGPNTVGECHPSTGNCTYEPICVECECHVCDDANPCTRDSCDHKTGCCRHRPLDCYELDDACTAWACELKYGGCHPVWHRDCNDHNPCTIDSCNPINGECISTPKDCASELNLTEPTQCKWAACNRETGACFVDGPELDDMNSCTEDLCDDMSGVYRIPVQCPDPVDACSESVCMDNMGGCVFIPILCNDDNACTDDWCDPDTGVCATRNRNCGCDRNGHVRGDECQMCGCSNDEGGCWTEQVDCNDNNQCTDDRCNPNSGCTHRKRDCGCDENGHLASDWCLLCGCSSDNGGCFTTGVDCDDKNAGTVDWCDSEAKMCVHRWNECPDDGIKCTEEKIDPATGECKHPRMNCNDYNLCTLDECVEETGTCSHEHVCSCNEIGPCWTCDCDPSTGECPSPIPKDCDDHNMCTDDACDGTTGLCVHTQSLPPQTMPGLDTPCMNIECRNDRGGWVSEVKDCRDGNPCTIDSCNELTGECVHAPRYECQPAPPCYESECDKMSGQCILRPVQIDDKDPCTIDACIPLVVEEEEDGNSSLLPSHGKNYVVLHNPACQPLVNDSCRRLVGCERSTGRCIYEPINCDDRNECTIDGCDPAVGCTRTQRNCDDGDPCTIDRCSTDAGGCTNEPIDCDDHDESTADKCVATPGGGHRCTHRSLPPCDDGLWCTIDERDRRTGECMHTPVECVGHRSDMCIIGYCDEEQDRCVYSIRQCELPPGSGCMVSRCIPETNECSEPTPMDCDDHDLCTVDGCDETEGACTHKSIACDDENSCTDDRCDHRTGECVHDPVVCSDSNACTEDICDEEVGECVHPPRYDCASTDPCIIGSCNPLTGSCVSTNVDCNDNDWCTNDTCVNGKCKHESINECQERPCYTAACFPGDGTCIYTPVICDDHDPRTIDSCDQETGRCKFVRNPCPQIEGDLCMEPELDDLTGSCIYKERKCDDNNLCTRDRCRRRDGACIHEERDCKDESKCTIDSCNPLTGECLNPQKDCNDGDMCTLDRCEESTGQCMHDPQWGGEPEFVCIPGHHCPHRMLDKCTCSECYPGNGLWYNSTVNCDDGDPCTEDSCLPVIGCIHETKMCPESLPCWINECNRYAGECENRMIDCNDGIPVTIDYCNQETGKCEHAVPECINNDPCIINKTNNYGICVATPKDCFDGNPCTMDECVKGECIHPYKSCEDNITCTYDYCQWNTGECIHDEVVCWTEDQCIIRTCVEGDGCVSEQKDCSDDDECTLDSCVSPQGDCVNVPIDVDDSDQCTMDACINGYPVHTPVVCNDQNPCTIDYCNSTTGICTNTRRECESQDPCMVGRCIPCIWKTENIEEKHGGGHWKPEEGDDDHECIPEYPGEEGGMYMCMMAPVVYKDHGPDAECREFRCDRETGKKITKYVRNGMHCGGPCKTAACLDGVCVVLGTAQCDEKSDEKQQQHHHDDDHKKKKGYDWNIDEALAFGVGLAIVILAIIIAIIIAIVWWYKRQGVVVVDDNHHNHLHHHHHPHHREEKETKVYQYNVY